MLGPSEFRELVSGRRRGVKAAAMRGLLRALEVPYSAAMRVRNWRYDTGRAEVHAAGVPVISVGNITLGGTGKTPVVEWLARWLTERGVRVGIVSRGYGAKDGRPNDEALELAEKLPEVPHVQDADRVRGAQRATSEFGSQVLVLDDGFQHRRLKRDFDLVLIDALEPDGFEHVFPRGTLREPLTSWARADGFLLTRADQVNEAARMAIRERALSVAPRAVWAEAAYVPRYLLDAAGGDHPLDTFAGKPVAAFCGIGNPDAFRRSLEDAGLKLASFRTLPDHYAYPAAEVTELGAWAKSVSAAAAVCTYKDLVKVRGAWPAGVPLVALASRLEVTSGQAELEAALQYVIGTPGSS